MSNSSNYTKDVVVFFDGFYKPWTWGANYSGILGDNSTTSKSTPVAVCGF